MDAVDHSGGESMNSRGSGELEDYATFIRREMPTLVRRELEALFRDEFRDVEQRVRPRVAEIVLNLQPRLVNLYKQSQIPLSEYGPQQPGDVGTASESTLTPLLSQGAGSVTATSTNSTPGVMLGAESFVPAAEPYVTQLHPYGNRSDNWGMAQPQVYDTNTGLGSNWDLEFEKLLNPMAFVLPSSSYL